MKDPIFYILDLFGVAVFAVSGALSAGRKDMDFLGVIIIAAVTAVGGGTLRDILLNRHPIFWISDTTYLIVIIFSAVFTLCFMRMRKKPGRALLIADAMGLALFTISGTNTAGGMGLPPIIAVLMGTMTGVAGGVIRDILSAEIPLILHRDIYATAAITGSSFYLAIKATGIPSPWAFGIGMAVVFAMRLAAVYWGWQLPVFRLHRD